MARYKMRQHLLSLGEDYTIEDESGHPVYKVDGKLLRIRETFVIEDRDGNEVATIREKKIALRDSMKILRGGDTIATIRSGKVNGGGVDPRQVQRGCGGRGGPRGPGEHHGP